MDRVFGNWESFYEMFETDVTSSHDMYSNL